ncbi:MAG: RsmB/NOP family class I SAM-dependent RNA methyltransferase [Pseudomonadota bacterium]
MKTPEGRSRPSAKRETRAPHALDTDAQHTQPPRAGRPARDAAVAAVRAVRIEGQTLDAALAANATRNNLDPRDRAFAHLIAATVLRRWGSLGHIIEAHLPRGWPPKSGPLRETLAVAAAQMTLLGVSPYAAIDIAVAQTATHRRMSPFKGLANAVLRRVSESGVDQLAAVDAVAADVPDWLLARWAGHYGAEAARALGAAALAPAPLVLRPRDPNTAADLAAALGGALLPTGSVAVDAGGVVSEKPGYGDGTWWVQDAAASLPALLIEAPRGARVLDLCAAPGGKTLQLAARGYDVTAVDQSKKRMSRVEENLARCNLTAELVTADIMAWEPEVPADAILLDAPCSATGTMRRHPDMLHNRTAADLLRLVPTQEALLARAIDWLKPGGALIYCTCSLEPEEGAQQIARLLASRDDVQISPIRPMKQALQDHAAPDADTIPASFVVEDGTLRTRPTDWPEFGGIDGFYAARLVRT